MDLNGAARKIVKLALRHVDSPDVFFELLWRQTVLARQKSWLTDDRARLLAAMLASGDTSAAQLFQDVWVLFETGRKSGGFFVEFGATNGHDLSNTYLLERQFGWTGIVAEPNPVWHAELRRNRPNAVISTDCVWSRTGENLPFLATSARELSTIASFAVVDRHRKTRQENEEITVPSISLNDLLEKHHAPRAIDYISVDTEGSEYDILKSFDFDRWDVSLFSIEHNFTDNEQRIADLVAAKGYDRRFPEFSRFDGWFRKRRD